MSSSSNQRDRQPILRLIIRILINMVAVWVAAHLISGISLGDEPASLLVVAVIFGIVNALIKPVFQLLTCPLQLVTLGLITLVVNALLLGLTAWIAQRLSIPFVVNGVAAAFLGAIVISIVSWALTRLV